MKSRSPLNLSAYSLNCLVTLTVSILQQFHTSHIQNETICAGDLHSHSEHKKRKLLASSATSSDSIRPRKRMRRHSSNCSVIERDSNNDESTSKDDSFIPQCSVVDSVIILKNYFRCLPENLWNEFFNSTIDVLNNSEAGALSSSTGMKAFELLFSKKISHFSTKKICPSVYEKCEKFLFERLRLCRNLKILDVQYSVNPAFSESFLHSLSFLRNLRSITLIPERKQSFHAAIPLISTTCLLAEELTVVYSSESLSQTGYAIDCLHYCTRLRKMVLYSYGRGAEAQSIQTLLLNLKDLRYVFHRELPHAIIDIVTQGSKLLLKLQVLLLAMYCKGIGSQLCYLPCDSLVQITSICPDISELKIVKPSNLSLIARSIPRLSDMEIHDCDITESLGACIKKGDLNNLKTLSLNNIEAIDFGCVLIISKCCPQLEDLKILYCNLFWSRDLSQVMECLFPKLKTISILKSSATTEQTKPRFLTPHTLYIDKTFVKLTISGAKNLEKIYLEFDKEAVLSRDRNATVREDDLISYIGNCKNLKEIMLLSCPNVTFRVIHSLVEACPKLKHLRDIELWGIPLREMDQILKKFSHLFIQSC